MVKRKFLYVLGAMPAILCLMPSAAYAGWEWRSENELTCELQPQMLESWNGAVTYGQVQVCNVQPVLRWEYVPDATPNDSVAPVSPPPNPSSSSSDSSSSDQPNFPNLSSVTDNVVNNMVEDLLQDTVPEKH
jgi:hypothetical protein